MCANKYICIKDAKDGETAHTANTDGEMAVDTEVECQIVWVGSKTSLLRASCWVHW